MMVKASVGTMEMVAEDDANKRYTVKETKTGKLTTIYWSEKTNAPEVIEGDFSAIPAAPPTGGIPAPGGSRRALSAQLAKKKAGT